MPSKKGLMGSIQVKVDAIPLVPAIRAKTGVIQHKEAVNAVSNPAPSNLFLFLISFLII
ncbi:hypothetical protein EV196_11223 [Mariniflexile fucanivorans]|uniref:Uncharacterized protein n=1 Tax=Mariniflexile fucanivorans TaxID=264023 RepID=A0A4R1RAA2_9FLAO|nr:hypothetical protein EV196_11223 [Mariniflexile fucanivorans]